MGSLIIVEDDPIVHNDLLNSILYGSDKVDNVYATEVNRMNLSTDEVVRIYTSTITLVYTFT